MSRWVCVSTSNLPYLLPSWGFPSPLFVLLWSHSSFTCMQHHSQLVAFDRSALMEWKAIEAVKACFDEDGSDGLISGSKHFRSFSVHCCMLKIQESHTLRCEQVQGVGNRTDGGFAFLKFELELPKSASIMLTWFGDLQVHLSLFPWEISKFALDSQHLPHKKKHTLKVGLNYIFTCYSGYIS